MLVFAGTVASLTAVRPPAKPHPQHHHELGVMHIEHVPFESWGYLKSISTLSVLAVLQHRRGDPGAGSAPGERLLPCSAQSVLLKPYVPPRPH